MNKKEADALVRDLKKHKVKVRWMFNWKFPFFHKVWMMKFENLPKIRYGGKNE